MQQLFSTTISAVLIVIGLSCSAHAAEQKERTRAVIEHDGGERTTVKDNGRSLSLSREGRAPETRGGNDKDAVQRAIREHMDPGDRVRFANGHVYEKTTDGHMRRVGDSGSASTDANGGSRYGTYTDNLGRVITHTKDGDFCHSGCRERGDR